MKHLLKKKRRGCLTVCLEILQALAVLSILTAVGFVSAYHLGCCRPFFNRLEHVFNFVVHSDVPAIETVPTPKDEPEPSQVAETASGTEAQEDLPYDKLFITVERQKYKDGDLGLIIPKLGINGPVWDGTDTATLNKGACLYEYAQLPGEGNRNVSIAGHRNGRVNGKVTDDAIFYYIDTLGEGDYLYLEDAGHIYRYKYLDTFVVEADDWGPIYSQGFSCLTLTSCTPIGISDHRIIVRGQLDVIVPWSANFVFSSNDGT